MPITMKEVSSSNIARIGYDPNTELLIIEFKRKDGVSTYEYDNFPRELYEEFLAAPSIGGFFGSRIRPHYAGRKVS